MIDDIYGNKSSGGGESHTPVEDPDSLQSTAYARVLDLVSEGPIVGLVNGQQSVFLNETPLANPDGSSNFSGVTIDQRLGTQDQSYMQGFPSVESETALGVEVTATKPWSLGINNLSLSAVRLRIAFPALYEQKDNGDVVGTTVQYRIDLATDGGAFQPVLEESVVGKTTGGYEQSRRVNLPRATTGWVVRVTRITPDSTSAKLANKTTVASYTEVIDAKFRYPNSAYIGVSVDASQFGSGSIPSRAFHLKGRVIRVPSNYNPDTRTYTGVWDGTFKAAYSNNPAWVFFDLCTHFRYGLGHLISAAQVDRYTLYQIARYCDELVSDGRGGQEPRFTCNAFFQGRVEAVKMLQDLAAIFRGMSYWAGSSIIVSADMPADPVYSFSNSNVINGRFIRGGSSKKSRASVALVSWNDPSDFYRSKVEYVEDSDTLKLFGYQPVEMSVTGCTSQGQAQRAGRWALLTNKLETGSISFEIGLEGGGKYIRPGAVIKIADANFAGQRIGGRLRSATLDVITVDGTVQLSAGAVVTVILPAGIAQARTIGEALGENRYRVTERFDAAPVTDSPWVYETTELVTELYRIVSIAERDGENELGYKVSAVTYAPGKHNAVDSGTRIDTRPVTIIPPSTQKAPANVQISESQVVEQGISVNSLDITWDKAENASYYEIQWRRDSLQWVSAGQTSQLAVTVQGIYTGNYEARVRAFNALGVASTWAKADVTPVRGKTGAPPALASLVASTDRVFSIVTEWTFPEGAADTAFTEIVSSKAANFDDATPLGQYAYPTTSMTVNGAAAGVDVYYWGRLVDKAGNVGPWTGPARGHATTSAEAVNDVITQEFLESAFGEQFFADVELITADASVPGSVNARLKEVNDAAAAADAQLQQGLTDTNTAVAAIQDQIDDIGDLADSQEYKADRVYAAGKIVTQANSFYQAKVDVPTGKAPPDTTYWRDVGDIIRQGDGLAARVTSNEQSITQQGTTITANSNDITQLKSSIAGKADASALNALTTRVSNVEGVNTSQATAITNLQTSVTDINKNKADASALNSLTTRVSTAEGNITSQGNSITQLQGSVKSNTDGLAATNQTVSNLSSTVTQQGTALTSQGQSITSINAALGDAGGENLIPNPSFDVNTGGATQTQADYWGGYANAGTVTRALVASELEPAGKAAQAAFTALTSNGYLNVCNNAKISVGPNVPLTASIYAKVPNNCKIQIWAQFRDGSEQVLSSQASPFTTGDNTFRRYSFNLGTTPANTVGVYVYFEIRGLTTAEVSGTVVYDRAQLERGTVATGWSDNTKAAIAAINAQATATSQLSGRVTSVEGTLTSQASSITSLRSDLSNAGGENLLYNPAFVEVNPANTSLALGWNTDGANVTDPAYTSAYSLVTSWLDVGQKAGRIDFKGLTENSRYFSFSTTPQYRAYATSGQQLTCSGYVRGTPGIRMRIFIQAINASGVAITAPVSNFFTLTAAGARISFSAAMPDGTVRISVFFRVYAAADATGDGYMELTRAQLEAGSTATGWSNNNRALSDKQDATSTALSNLTTTVTNQGGSITSQAGQITSLQSTVGSLQTSKADASAVTNLGTRVTTVEGAVTTQSNQITALQAQISGVGAFTAAQNFEFLNTLRGFYLEQAASGAALTAYQQNATITGYANLRSPVFADTNGAQNPIVRMRIRRKNTTRNPIRIYWANEDGGLAEARTATVNIDLNNTGWQDVELDLSGNAAWATKTKNNSIRFDLLNTADTTAVVDIAYVAVGRRGAAASATALSDTQAIVTSQGNSISSLVSKTDTLQTTVNGQTTSIQQISQVQQDTNNRIAASWQVKFGQTTAGLRYVAGIGLNVESGPGNVGLQSTIALAADRLLILGPGIDGNGRAFLSVVNGQTFINEAFIDKATIRNAIIGQSIESANRTQAGVPIMNLDFNSGAIYVRSEEANLSEVQIDRAAFRCYVSNRLRVRVGRW